MEKRVTVKKDKKVGYRGVSNNAIAVHDIYERRYARYACVIYMMHGCTT